MSQNSHSTAPAGREASIDGEEGRRRHAVYLRWEPTQRNALWEADHKELGVGVLTPRAPRPSKPWVTLFVGAYSRPAMGWAISTYPAKAITRAAASVGTRCSPLPPIGAI